MFFLGITQHSGQLTVSVRDHQGDVILARKISRPQKILEFFDHLTRRCARREEYFIVLVEVCGLPAAV